MAVATVIGAYLGSEVLTNVFGMMTRGPEIDGLVVIPAVLTGLVLGLFADALARYIALEVA